MACWVGSFCARFSSLQFTSSPVRHRYPGGTTTPDQHISCTSSDTLTLPLAHFHLPMQTFPDVPRPRFGNSVAMVNGATNKSYQFTIAQIHLFELHACIRSRGSDCRDVEHDIFGHVRSWVWRLRKLWALNWRNASPRTNPKPD